MIIGLTGCIGSGKSTAIDFFKFLKIPVYRSDEEAKRLMESDRMLRLKIIDLLGEESYQKDKLNKAFVANKVFEDNHLLSKLNAFVHPLVEDDFKLFVKRQSSDYLVYESALLFEIGTISCDKVIVITAPLEDRILRVVRRDNTDRSRVFLRMKHQWSQEEKAAKADFVIHNVDRRQLKIEIENIHEKLMHSMKSNYPKMTIAIDGVSSTGKSSLAWILSERLDYNYLDTGAMYRALAFYALENGIIKADEIDQSLLIKELDCVKIDFRYRDGLPRVHLNGVDVDHEIRDLRVSSCVSKIASISPVRVKMVILQRQIGSDGGIVVEGRDIGTVVFPEAEFKFFITSSDKIRAERRFRELRSRGMTNVTLKEVHDNILERDQLDITRTHSPLRKADGAIEIDNSHLTKEEQLKMILSVIRKCFR